MQTIDFKNVKLLGICLGMQLLLNNSLEFEKCDGLGLIKGENIRLCDKGNKNEKLNVPHINWRSIEISSKHFEKDKLVKKINKEDEFYFIHSFMAQPLDAKDLVATYDYGGNKVPAIIKKDLIYGFQFHPEKSAEPGLKLLDQFLKL